MEATVAMIIMLGLMIGIPLYNWIYVSSDHTSCPNPSKLDPNARIVDFRQKRESRKSNHIRTTIVFSDGFEFVAYDSKEGWAKVYTTPELNREMMNRAIRSHSEAVEKARQKQ